MTTQNMTIQNFYEDSLKDVLNASDTIIYLNSIPVPSEGFLVISPDDPTKKEIIYYIASNSGAGSVTLPSAILGRGIGGTTPQAHAIGEPVKMTVVAEYWKALQDGTALADKSIKARHIETQEAWRNIGTTGQPSFENSWGNYDATPDSFWNRAAFMKDSLGFVHLKGMVKGGTINSTAAIFTLPVGYRPFRYELRCVQTNNGVGRLDVGLDGGVNCEVGNNTFVSLDGIIFKAEN